MLYKFFKWRGPPTEDDLKILKLEYLSNHLLDLTNILNWSLYDQSIFSQSFKWRRPPMEDNIKILKGEYLSTLLLDPTQISNSSLYDQTIMYKSFKWRFKLKTTSKYQKWIISATTVWIMTCVALLRPAYSLVSFTLSAEIWV